MLGLKQELIENYLSVRQMTEKICQPLLTEDYVIQSVLDVSPPKWHLAHTTWFFETFILSVEKKHYRPFHPKFHYLFNSYYHGIGQPFPRDQRGLLSRPTVEEIYTYRRVVDEEIQELINTAANRQLQLLQPLIILGIHHEQQHQELLFMDIKHNFSVDPNFPVYQNLTSGDSKHQSLPLKFFENKGGMVEIGYQGEEFSFDNETPRHKTFLAAYSLANRLVNNKEYREFIEAGAYSQPRWWLSDGWDCVQANQWRAPLYWQKIDDQWYQFTLSGLKKLVDDEPVVHVSFYEADAYARWKGLRLPYEAEWENFVSNFPVEGNFMDKGIYHPQATSLTADQPQQLFGDVWQWTASPYVAYPGFSPLRGALGEYNGKFMNNQWVLRGGSCITPSSHIRTTYRNFFQPDKRWQFSGIRLAKSL
jgi:ergothioneine biosynthesis protein EgtB